MNRHLCKPMSLCSTLLIEKKKKTSTSEEVIEPKAMSSVLKQLQNSRGVDTRFRQSDNSLAKVLSDRHSRAREKKDSPRRSTSLARQNARKDLVNAEVLAGSMFTNYENLPNLEAAYAIFTNAFPRYLETVAIDKLRSEEYGHLQETGRVCLDYCGFGLFSQRQQLLDWESASFALVDVSVNLCSHSLFGAAEEGTIELDIRKRIMEYLNIQDTEYSMVFTASRGAAFKLLADAYPFETCSQLITMYDYESESVGWMVQRAKEKGAKVSSACFRWPSLRICSTDLKKQLLAKKWKKGPGKGLFVFPVQSRVSGSKYSYQWMSLAQQNKWHVLLDASALAPKDMDSLGLSLFRPDFIIVSFYKVFGADPSGFGCLFIKNSAMSCVQDSLGAPVSGIVRIVPFPIEWLMNESPDVYSEEADKFQDLEGVGVPDRGVTGNHLTSVVSSFSGPFLGGLNDRSTSNGKFSSHCLEGDVEEVEENGCVCEENGNTSVGEVTRSPLFSEDGTDNMFYIDIGPSPLAATSRSSISENPFSGPIHSPLYGMGEGLDSCKSKNMNSPCTENGENSCSEDESEELKVNELAVHCISMYDREQGLQLLAPGNSPLKVSAESRDFTCHGVEETGTYSQGRAWGKNTRENLPCHTAMQVREGGLDGSKFCIVKSSSIAMEVAELHISSIGRDCNAINVVDTMKGKQTGLKLNGDGRGIENAVGNLEAITEIDAHADSCLSNPWAQEDQVNGYAPQLSIAHGIPMSEGQKGKEKESPTSWNQRENAICRETEGNFRLLGKRNDGKVLLRSRLSSGLNDSDELSYTEYSWDEGERDPFRGGECPSSVFHQNDDACANENEIAHLWIEREPEVSCKFLDHADMLGLNKTSFRLRYLVNWLLHSLLQLCHPGPEKHTPLVHIYGPHVRFNRGASVAFNLYDCYGKLLHPELIQKLADRNNISLGIGFLWNIRFLDNHRETHAFGGSRRDANIRKFVNGDHNDERMPVRIEVVTAALSLLSNFEDAYRLWSFVARFLDADYVSREVGHHRSTV